MEPSEATAPATGGGERLTADEDQAFSADGVDLTLIRWFLGLSHLERLQAAQDMIDTVWMLREAE